MKTSNEHSNSRRQALKSLSIAGGVTATGASIPSTWTTPIVESIAIPAHAQTTSGAQDGTFGTAVLTVENSQWWKRSPLLDGLLPSAYAHHDDIAEGTCSAGGETQGIVQVHVNIVGSAVNICFSNSGTSDNEDRCTGEAHSTISGNVIADTQIKAIDRSINETEDQETVIFRNLLYIPEHPTSGRPAISGKLTVRDSILSEVSPETSCSVSFVADLIDGAVYSCTSRCTSD